MSNYAVFYVATVLHYRVFHQNASLKSRSEDRHTKNVANFEDVRNRLSLLFHNGDVIHNNAVGNSNFVSDIAILTNNWMLNWALIWQLGVFTNKTINSDLWKWFFFIKKKYKLHRESRKFESGWFNTCALDTGGVISSSGNIVLHLLMTYGDKFTLIRSNGTNLSHSVTCRLSSQ